MSNVSEADKIAAERNILSPGWGNGSEEYAQSHLMFKSVPENLIAATKAIADKYGREGRPNSGIFIQNHFDDDYSSDFMCLGREEYLKHIAPHLKQK